MTFIYILIGVGYAGGYVAQHPDASLWMVLFCVGAWPSTIGLWLYNTLG